MSNLIQIKRSLNTAAPTSLANGELAYTANGDTLAIGSNGSIVYIGGKRNPGVLTANQALVANSSSAIDKINVANLVPTYIYANGAFGTANQFLTANSTGGVYWLTPAPSVTGSNTQIQFNDSGTLNASAGFIFNKSTNTVTVSNNMVVLQKLNVGNAAGFDFGATAAIEIDGSTNSYMQSIIQNANTGNNASSDLVITADTGNDSVNFVDFGINSSTYANALFNITGALDAYLYTSDSHLAIGTASATKELIFHAGGTTSTDRKLTVNASSVKVNTSIQFLVGGEFIANSTGAYHTGVVNAATHSSGAGFTANSTLVNAAAINVVNQVNTATLYATTTVNVGSLVQANTTALLVGSNSTVNTVITPTSITQANTTNTTMVANVTGIYHSGTINAASHTVGTSTIANSSGVYTTGTINSASFTTTGVTVNTTQVSVGANSYMNATTYFVGNSTVNTNISAGSIVVNGAITANNTGVSPASNTTGTALGSATARFVINANTINASGLITGTAGADITGTANASTSMYVGANVYSNTTAKAVGNSTVNAYFTSSLFSVTNSTSSANLQAGVLTIGTSVVNTTAIAVGDLVVNGNTIIGSNTQDIVTLNALVNTAIMPNANATYNLGNTSMRWNEVHAANVHSVKGYFDGDVQISGNLVVLGTSVTINVSSVSVTDSLLELASNNNTNDLIDIGLFGHYESGLAPNEHAGFFRDASDNGIFKFFQGLTEQPTTTVNTAAASYSQATVQAYLLASALIANSTVTNITANSTVSVGIVANTLTLSTALSGIYGGTGLTTYTQEDILVANSTNGFRKLSLGSDGYVLQSNGTALVYNTLDGGSF